MRALICFLILIFSSRTFADCQSAVDQIASTDKVYMPLTSIELRDFESAFRHHQGLIRTAKREFMVFYYRQRNRVTGYEVWVRGAEPGTEVSYVLDLRGKLVLGRWNNRQGNYELWFCGRDEEISVRVVTP